MNKNLSLIIKHTKQKINFVYFLFGMLLIFSCSRTSHSKVFVKPEDFRDIVDFTENAGLILNFNQLVPSSIKIIDSLIVISDYTENPRLHIYGKDGRNFLTSFGFIGKGPNEFSAPEWNGQTFSKENNPDTYIFIYEFGYGMFHEVNLSAILRNEENFYIGKYYLPPDVMNADNIYFVNDTLYGEATYNMDVKYFKYKIEDENFIPIGDFNDADIVKNSKFLDKKTNLDRSFMSYSEDNLKFVSAYLRFNKIVIMNKNMDEELIIYYGKDEKYPKSDDFMDKSNVLYFNQPYAGKKFIYVPFVGVQNSEGFYPKELQVYDYDGNPIKIYRFSKSFTSFTIDEEKKKIYLVRQEDSQYLSYEL